MKDGLKELESLRQTAPRHTSFDVADLDEIAADVDLEKHRLSVTDGTYLSDLETRLDWWLALWELIEGNGPDATQHKLTARLVDNVTPRWAGIKLERPVSEKLASKVKGAKLDLLAKRVTDADLDLLKHYRRMTRNLRDRTRTVWPEVDLGWLWGQA